MTKPVKDLGLLFILAIISTILIWLPFLLRLPSFLGLDFSGGFATVYRNFDGLEYVMIAKTFYHPIAFSALPQSLPAQYFASHFPGYALFILIFAPLLGFLKSMLFVSTLFSVLSVIAFYYLIRDFKLTSHPLFLSIIFLILPARWLIVRNVGSAETVFIFFTIMTFYFFLKYEELKKYSYLIYASLFAAAAQFTRPPGILIFIALALYLLWNFYQTKLGIRQKIKEILRYIPLIFIPLTLIVIFIIFQIQLGDFWAYFHSGDNIHLTFPPFQVFNKSQFWVGDIWLEDIIYILLLGFLGGVTLFRQKLYPLAFFVLTYTTASSFIAHRDISRYILPVFPFVLIAFERYLNSKEFKIVLAIIIIAFYLYTENFLINNTAPFPNPNLFN